MGKSRARKAAKAPSVFCIARGGAGKARGKGRARRVTSGLRKINIENADKVNKINKEFSEIQKEVQQLSKGPVLEPQKNNQVSTQPEDEPANVDDATSLLSQL